MIYTTLNEYSMHSIPLRKLPVGHLGKMLNPDEAEFPYVLRIGVHNPVFLILGDVFTNVEGPPQLNQFTGRDSERVIDLGMLKVQEYNESEEG